MVILVDDREKGIVDELRHFDVDVSVTRLEFGDCMFTGRGPDGECSVGCERKRLSDLVNSMKDRRLSGHQLAGMRRCYDYCFLYVESVFRPGRCGEIEELQGHSFRPFYNKGQGSSAVAYRQLTAYLTSLELLGNIVVRRTSNARETACQWAALWHWWNDKDWTQHHSHSQIYTNEVLPNKAHGSQWGRPHSHDVEYQTPGRGRVGMTEELPTTVHRMAAQLPGVDRKAETVARHFKTARAMANATEKEWESIDFGMNREGTKRNPGIGKVTAKAVVRAITEEGA